MPFHTERTWGLWLPSLWAIFKAFCFLHKRALPLKQQGFKQILLTALTTSGFPKLVTEQKNYEENWALQRLSMGTRPQKDNQPQLWLTANVAWWLLWFSLGGFFHSLPQTQRGAGVWQIRSKCAGQLEKRSSMLVLEGKTTVKVTNWMRQGTARKRPGPTGHTASSGNPSITNYHQQHLKSVGLGVRDSTRDWHHYHSSSTGLLKGLKRRAQLVHYLLIQLPPHRASAETSASYVDTNSSTPQLQSSSLCHTCMEGGLWQGQHQVGGCEPLL